MSNTQEPSKFEQMRSRRHMLNNLGNKPASNRNDISLIGGSKPVKPQQLPVEASAAKAPLPPTKNKQQSAFAKNANNVMKLELDRFKDWTGLNRSEDGFKSAKPPHMTPQAAHLSGSGQKFAFNNDRSAIGNTSYSQYSGIMRKEDYNQMNVGDIDGATSHNKSHIQRKVYNKKSEIEKYMKSSSTLNNGMRIEPTGSRGSERIFDTKRFMRVDDIPGARPKNSHAVNENDKEKILSENSIIEQNYQNSQYFIKQKERQGRLPFTRRVNKGLNKIDKSLVSSMDPATGEK